MSILPPNDISVGSPGDQAVAVGLQQIGKPYVYGATGPNSFDCSGFTSYSYINGPHINIGRDTTAQWTSNLGATIYEAASGGTPPATLDAGDLVFYGSSGSTGPNAHVQMATGRGLEVIEAPFTGANVRFATANFQQGGDEPFKGIRRFGGGTSGGSALATGTPAIVNPADILASTADNVAANATTDLPDPRNNKPFSPAFLGQSVPGGTLGGFRFNSTGNGTTQGGTQFPETNLVRGGISEMDLSGPRPRGPFQVFFMMNPQSISVNYQIQTDVAAAQSTDPAILANQNYPVQNQGVSFDLLFNRQYEVWQGGFGGPSDIGCRWDVRAIERLMGLYDDKNSVKGLGKYEIGGYAPLGLPVIVVFGGPNSFQFQARINSLDIQYTRFSKDMIPTEAQVSISLLRVYIQNESTDLSTPLVQTYDSTAIYNPNAAVGTSPYNPPSSIGRSNGAGGLKAS